MQKPSARERDWISMVLLFFLLQVAAARLVSTDWAPFLYWTETLAGFGTILGLALGASTFGRRVVAVLAASYTAAAFAWQLTRSVTDDFFLDRLRHVGGILLISLNQFVQRQPVKDTLFFVLFVCLAFWLLSVAAGYWLARHGSVMTSIVLGGAAIITIQAYGDYQPRGSWWLAIYVLVALLLAGRVHYLSRKPDWAERRVFVSEESGGNILAGLFMTAALAVLVAWWIPSSPAAVQSAADRWNNLTRPLRERLSNAVTSLSGPYGKPGINFYGSSLALGQNAALGDAIVFTVEVVHPPASQARYYWRGRVYDDYVDGKWSASAASKLLFQPAQGDLGIPDAGGRSAARVRFTSEFPTQSLIYAPASAVWVDLSADVAATRAAPGVYDTVSWEARTVVSMGSSYEVRAEIANPNVEQLRAAGESYPDWIGEHYLAVPERFRLELQALAQQIAAGNDNVYDKAEAITNYLRLNLQYSESVPAPPEGQDPVMWVLMSGKKGFCTYYASAEVLLLRSLGIPARLAVGFARGDLEEGTYTVRRRDAHAWPEAYFPGIGWVEFEPTVNQAPLTRPTALPTTAGALGNGPQTGAGQAEEGTGLEEDAAAAARTPAPFLSSGAARALSLVLMLVTVLLLVYLLHRTRVLARLPAILSRAIEGGAAAPAWIRDWDRWNRLEAVERAFATVTWSLRLLGKPPAVGATPAARAATLSRILPSAAGHIDALKAELESGLFTPQPADMKRAGKASIMILLHGLRARLDRIVSALDGRDVYSNQDY